MNTQTMDEIIKEFIDRNNENAAFINYVGNLYQIPQLIESTKKISSKFHLYIKDAHLFDLS